MSRWYLLLLILAALQISPVVITKEDVLEHNQQISAQWVNWCPASWSKDTSVHELAQQLAMEAGCKEDIPQMVHDWVCENIYYDWDAFNAGTYYELAAPDVLLTRKSVCEGIANLVQSLLLEAGIPCIKVWGVAIEESTLWTEISQGISRVNHTWNEFYINGYWYALDCTMDIQSRYENGVYTFIPGKNRYVAPGEDFFAETHRILRRGEDFPENIPTQWAMDEIEQAVITGVVPLELLRNYRDAITGEEFAALFDIDCTDMSVLCRGDASLLLAEKLEMRTECPPPYSDVSNCNDLVQTAVSAMSQLGLMRGTSDNTFSPDEFLTRQEAIIIAKRISDLEG